MSSPPYKSPAPHLLPAARPLLEMLDAFSGFRADSDEWKQVLAESLDSLKPGFLQNPGLSELFESLPGGASLEKNPGYGEDVTAVKLWNEHKRACMNYQEDLSRAATLALDKLRNKLLEYGLSGRQITTLRQFYDLWMESQQDAYSEIVFTEEHSQNFAGLVNSFMALKKHVSESFSNQS